MGGKLKGGKASIKLTYIALFNICAKNHSQRDKSHRYAASQRIKYDWKPNEHSDSNIPNKCKWQK